MMSILLISLMFTVPLSAQNEGDEYTESYVVTIHWCHYLEFVQEATNHTFIVRLYSDDISSVAEFEFTGRYYSSNVSLLLNSSSERYWAIFFEVYEIINETRFPCDLTEEDGIDAGEITFDTYTGHWTGDDNLKDASGYGRLNGCDDGSHDSFERDFELGFSVDVIDPDEDGIPRWIEENVYGTDPFVNDVNRDDDADEVPLAWEWRYGFDPFAYDDHRHMDSENDGLTNYEEYRVSPWNSDPFRKDIFVELDQMQPGPNGNGFMMSPVTIMMVYQTFAKRNIVFHVDDGCMGGGEILPFEPMVWMGEERQYYQDYFLHKDPNNWRRGVFRYALYVNNHFPINGMEFSGENSLSQYFKPGLNSYVIATQRFRTATPKDHAFVMGHELGHTLGIYIGHPLGCDNQLMRNPFSIMKIIFRNYKSIMNYQYTMELLDYSDGSHGFGDYDDWGNMDLTFFQPEGAE